MILVEMTNNRKPTVFIFRFVVGWRLRFLLPPLGFYKNTNPGYFNLIICYPKQILIIQRSLYKSEIKNVSAKEY